LALVAIGVLMLAVGRIPGLGRLPGDFTFRRDGLTIYLPLATSLLVSAVLSAILYWLRR
jgi:hypothetical protein